MPTPPYFSSNALLKKYIVPLSAPGAIAPQPINGVPKKPIVFPFPQIGLAFVLLL